MQPHEGTKRAAGLSRARMFIRKELGWLQGFPLGATGWVHVAESSPAATLVLDRERLRLSVHTINMLRRDFPRALPRLVGDTERWAATHHALLDLLKPTIHDGAPLPGGPLGLHPFVGNALLQQSERLTQAAPQLRTWRTALEWHGWTDLPTLRTALAWLATHATALTRLRAHLSEDDPVLAVRLWQLARAHSPRRVAPLIALLADEALWCAPLECPESHQQQVREALKAGVHRAVPLPQATLPQRLIAWVHWLGEQETAVQRRGLDLTVLLPDTELLAPWPSWWAKIEAAIRQVRRAAKAARPRAYANLERLYSRTPPAVSTERLEGLLRGLLAPSTESLHGVAAKALALLPGIAQGCASRLAIAHHWLVLWDAADEHERLTLLRYVPAWVDYAKSQARSLGSRARNAVSWQIVRAHSPDPVSVLDEHVLSLLTQRQAMTTFFRVLRNVGGVSNRGEVRLLAALAAHLPSQRVDAAFAALRGSALAKEHGYLSPTSIRFCHDLTVAHPDQFAALLLRIEATDDPDPCVRLLRPVAANFATANLTGLLLEALVEGHLPELLVSAGQLSFSLAQGVPAPTFWRAAEPARWLERYPQPLHAALAELAHHDPAAEQSAAKALAKEFPERQAIEQELASLCAIASPTRPQQLRIDNLTARLTSTRRISAQRLMTLAVKLQLLLRHRVLEHWRLAVHAAFQAALPPYLGTTEVPEWVADSEVVAAIAAIAELPPASQSLARRVLAVRSGPAPWDLRDAPANHDYLATLRSRGIEWGPWIDDAAVTEYTMADGQLLRLSLERDPLAILNMGGHFGTCLSPGHCNFFSVFANIADVNKQVLYARTASGGVYGRVLLALTDAGGLLTFHCYAHGNDASFTAVVKHYVHTLAERMNTLVVQSGTVATLVAERWYDDGPVDLTQQIPALEPGSMLRQALPTLSPHALVTTLTRALSPLPVNELTLPLVLTLPELATRRELLVALLPLIERTALSLSTLVALVRSFENPSGAPPTALLEQLFQQARLLPSYQFAYDAAELLADHAPVLALRLLRLTRERDVRSFSDESDGWRLSIAARAAEKLRRRRQAKALYELALARAYNRRLKEECRAALERLA